MDSRVSPILFLLLITLYMFNQTPYTLSLNNDYRGFTRSILLYAPAVSRGGGGALIRVNLTLKYPGSGYVFFSAKPLVELDTQATARIAAFVASAVTGNNYYDYDYYVVMTSDSIVVGGPSAGALMAIGFISLFLNRSLNTNVSITGMINPDGSIGPVGGLMEKLEAVASNGYKLFLIPLGQRIVYVQNITTIRYPWGYYQLVQYTPVDLVEEGAKLGVAVVEVGNIFDAVKYFLNISFKPVEREFKIDDRLMNEIKSILDRNTAYINGNYSELNSVYQKLELYYRLQLRDLYNGVVNEKSIFDKLIANGRQLAAFEYSYIVLKDITRLKWICMTLLNNRVLDEVFENVSILLTKLYSSLSEMVENPGGVDLYELEAHGLYYKALKNYQYATRSRDRLTLELFNNLVDSYISALKALDLINTPRSGGVYVTNDIVQTLYGLADATLSYGYSLTRDTGSTNSYLDEAFKLYDQAVEAYGGNYTLSSVNLLVESIAFVNIGVETLFINNNSVLANITRYLRVSAEYFMSIYNTSQYSIQLYLVGNELLDSGLYVEASVNYIKAILYTVLFSTRMGSPRYSNIAVNIPTPLPSNTTTRVKPSIQPIIDIIYMTALLAIGLVIGLTISMLIYFTYLSRKYEKATPSASPTPSQ